MSDMLFTSNRFRKLLEQNSENPDTHSLCQLAKQYNYRSYYHKAIESAKKSLELNNDNWEAWGELIMASGYMNYDEIKELKSELDEKFDTPEGTSSPDLLRNLALVNYFLEDDAVALNLIEKSIELKSDCSVAHEIKGYILHAAGQLDNAIAAFGESVKLDGNSCRSLRMIGKCYLEQGNSKKGIGKIEQAIRIEHCFLAAWHLLGEHYLENNKYLEGLQCFSKAMAINPKNWGTYFILAEYFMGEGHYEIAIAEVKKLFLFEDDKEIKAEALNLIGYAYYLKGNSEDASYYYNTAIAFNPEFSLPYFNLGELELDRKKFDKAIHFFSESLKRDPHHIPSITQSGFAYINLKKMDQAEKMFSIAIELEPEEFWAYLGLSEIARIQKNAAYQLVYASKAEEYAPDSSIVQNYIGIAHQCNGNIDLAEQAYLKSLKADPMNRKTANNLAYLYEKQFRKATEDKEKKALKSKAIDAWKLRLLSCRAAGSSIKGAQNHLLKLGLKKSEIENILRMANVEEIDLIKLIRQSE